MMCYASRTGTERNLRALRAAGWGLLVSRVGVWRTEGFRRYVLDNGAWADFQAGRPFEHRAFGQLLGELGRGADWVVLPDIVAGGLDSLALSMRWRERCLASCPKCLIAVQDGMQEADLAPLVGPDTGIFLGGSTLWKLANMRRWGAFCAQHHVHYHVARVNTEKRIFLAQSAGADSIDGSNGSRFACNIPRLNLAMGQDDLFSIGNGGGVDD